MEKYTSLCATPSISYKKVPLENTSESLLLEKDIFILTGKPPKMNSRNMNQADVSDLIFKHSGRIRSKVPQTRSAKKYIVLIRDIPDGKEALQDLKRAVRQGHHVVNYEYLYDTVSNGIHEDFSDHCPIGMRRLVYIQKDLSFHERNQKKGRRLISLLRQEAKKAARLAKSVETIQRLPRNPAHVYAKEEYQKRYGLSKNVSLDPSEKKSRGIPEAYNALVKEFPSLGEDIKERYSIKWRHLCSQIKSHNNSILPKTTIPRVYFWE